MIARSPVLFALAIGLGGAGCGAGGAAPPEVSDPDAKQEVTRVCLVEEGFNARSVGEAIEIDGPEGPRVEFNISAGESETRTFKGEAQGAMQIGSTLVFVGPADDEELKKIETCVIG